ncbi:hypothetical protein [Paraburkholderia bannensis]|nr:hypothetical protein [Paraburkholderia bannensis]
MNGPSYRIVLLANGYMEMAFVGWSQKWVYRRTVDFNDVVWC